MRFPVATWLAFATWFSLPTWLACRASGAIGFTQFHRGCIQDGSACLLNSHLCRREILFQGRLDASGHVCRS
jgi:hypothetical protein